MKINLLKSCWPAAPLLFLLLVVFMSAEPDEPLSVEWLSESKSLQASTVLLSNSKSLVPLSDLEQRSIAVVNVGPVFQTEFNNTAAKYARLKSFSLVSTNLRVAIDSLRSNLQSFNTIILQATDGSLKDALFQTLVKELCATKEVIFVVYGQPSNLQFFDKVGLSIIWTPTNSPAAAIYAAQAVFGGIGLSATLMQDVSPVFASGTGLSTTATRLKYTIPEELGIESKELEKPIDRIVEEAIAQRATPGAVVMVVKDGKVILNKGYGTHTYTSDRPTTPQDIFDLASVTKIGATTMAAMRLYEQGKLRLNAPIGSFIPLARKTDKSDITIRELLLHEAGLVPYIPFFESLKPGDSSRDSSFFHPLKVADSFYLRANYFEDVMWPRMLNSRLSARGKHVYSDLSMYILKDIIERLSEQKFDEYVQRQFYAPLGMYTSGFNPRTRFPKSRIVPTEQDNYFRKTLLEGYVHDQGASMAGGVSGHAGLFSTANDMAILFQMILNGGTYGGKQYFNAETINLFTSKNSELSRRGLGFDRWDPDRKNRYPSDLASPKTFGHTGYTGTCVWVDPEYNLIYIFLSNRVHPSVSNKLSSLRIRPRIHDVIYKAIKDAED